MSSMRCSRTSLHHDCQKDAIRWSSTILLGVAAGAICFIISRPYATTHSVAADVVADVNDHAHSHGKAMVAQAFMAARPLPVNLRPPAARIGPLTPPSRPDIAAAAAVGQQVREPLQRRQAPSQAQNHIAIPSDARHSQLKLAFGVFGIGIGVALLLKSIISRSVLKRNRGSQRASLISIGDLSSSELQPAVSQELLDAFAMSSLGPHYCDSNPALAGAQPVAAQRRSSTIRMVLPLDVVPDGEMLQSQIVHLQTHLDALSFLVAADGISVVPPGVDWSAILEKSAKRALGSGRAGASAAVVQVLSLMWLRTAMNYQYRYGGDLESALKKLTDEGGIARLYKGLPFALVQGPISKFGDTATNVGILALLDSIPETAGLALPIKTAVSAFAAGLWRIVCMPVDTSKTVLQVEGQQGLDQLKQRVQEEGPSPLWAGSLATAAASITGNYPWFLTFNFLDGSLPPVSKEDALLSLGRSALLGLSASCVSDTITNPIRVIKTTKQTSAFKSTSEAQSETSPGTEAALVDKEEGTGELSYGETLSLVLETDGIEGLLTRGLKTRLLTNAIQGALFSVLWKYFQAM